jgi:hypothetical protein
MKWLVTFKDLTGRDKILEQLRSLGCEVLTADRTMPLGDDEEVLSVEGPANLPELAEPFKNTMKMYPNSKMTGY